ncbi:MAG: flagellar biosynthetic protein FliR [Planctomycetaceae bacterium]|nr:flagellar biosynthetic protein FliR [Planctomycetaceae bacterium]
MSAWTEVITAAALQPWMAMAPGLLLAALRWFGCLCWLPALPAALTLRMRLVLSLVLAVVVLPATGTGWHWIPESGTTSMLVIACLSAAVGELVLGGLLGLGVRITFASLQLAGELIDHQAGLAFQQVLNPLADDSAGPATSTLTWLGVAAFLALPAAGGDLVLADAMLQQFSAIPVGSASIDSLEGALPMLLVEQSLVLAVRIAGPVLAALSLITTATVLLGRSTPQLPLGSIVGPVRVAMCLALLAGAIPGTTELFADHIEMLTSGNAGVSQSPETFRGE